MAQNQVAALLEGHLYQGLFFWREAAALLNKRSSVRRVDLEHDAAAGADDVAVFYEEPGLLIDGWHCNADFYQVKYHVDLRKGYSPDLLCERRAGGNGSSLLERLHNAYKSVAGRYGGLRIHLASNWPWSGDDALAKSLREYDGSLPPDFFSAGPRSVLGKIRESMRSHLKLQQDRFVSFAKTLRFGLNHLGRRDFTRSVHDSLAAVGLRVPVEGVPSPYETLARQFITNGPNSFDRETLRKICDGHDLFDHDRPTADEHPIIGVRTFLRFAERMEDEVDELLSLSDAFEGRHLREGSSWPAVAAKVVEYFKDPARRGRLRQREHALMLECHGSVATLVGYELSRNSGCLIVPLQKPGRVLWTPSVSPPTRTASPWIETHVPRSVDAPDVAVAISVTNDINADVARFLDAGGAPAVRELVSLSPTGGVGPLGVTGADHAFELAASLVALLNRVRPEPTSRVHFFFSGPNALLFFFGQFRDALGRVTFYEYDFGRERHASYEPCVSLPHPSPPRPE